MSIEGLGRKFQDARNARGLTLEEAARLTKIKASRLTEIEADDFSKFPSLAYARGFLQIYGRFLSVDVAPYLDAFETSDQITVDGYSYLQDSPMPRPSRTPVAPRRSSNTSLLPLIIGLLVFFVGFWLIRLMLNVQRIAPRQNNVASALPAPSTSPSTVPIAARRAQPVESPASTDVPAPTSTAVAVSTPSTPPTALAIASPSTTPAPTEPEIRRAQPVLPDELNAALKSGPATANRVEIRPLKKTYVQVTSDDDPTRPAFERWVSPADGVVEFRGRHFRVRVLDRDAVQIRKNGRVVYNGDPDVRIE